MTASILFINPFTGCPGGYIPPRGLLILAAQVKSQGHRVRLVDFTCEPINFQKLGLTLDEFSPDIVGISILTIQAFEGYRIGRFIKDWRSDIRLAYGGVHSTVVPAEPFKLGGADLVIKGNAISGLEMLMRGVHPREIPNVLYREGYKLQSGKGISTIVSPGSLPMPAYDLIDWSRTGQDVYGWDEDRTLNLPVGSIDDVVSLPDGGGGKAASSYTSITKLLSEIRRGIAAGFTHIRFCGRDFLSNDRYVQTLCAALRASNPALRWSCLATPESITSHKPTLALMFASGCVGIGIEFSSGKTKLDRSSCHRSYDEVTEAYKIIAGSGIKPTLMIETYSPGEMIEGPWRVSNLVKELKDIGSHRMISNSSDKRTLANVTFTFCTPYPGRKCLDNLDADSNAVLGKSWNQYTARKIGYIPETFLNDIPVRNGVRSNSEIRSLLEECREIIGSWASIGFYLPESISKSANKMDNFLAGALEVYEQIDGRSSVRRLFESVKQTVANLEVHCALISLLSILRVIRSFGSAPDERTRTSLRAEHPPAARDAFFCSRPWTGFEVGEEDGVVRMCCWAKKGYGNVNDQTISEIWNGPAIQEMRSKMATGQWPEICESDCPYIAGYMSDDVPANPLANEFSSNLSLNVREITERKSVLESLPRYWKVAHSTLCNLDCIMCYQDRNNKQTLPSKFYEDLKLYYPYMQELLLMGGEPLMIREARQLVQTFPVADCPDIRFSLITNGTIFDARTMNSMAQVPISWVVISIDAAKSETYAHIRKHGDLTQTLKGVQAWKELSDDRNFSLVLSFTVMRDNVTELAEFVRLSHEYGVECQFSPVHGTKASQHLIDPTVLHAEIDRALHLVSKLGMNVSTSLAGKSLRALRDGL